MNPRSWIQSLVLVLLVAATSPIVAQESTRQEILLEQRREKARQLAPEQVSPGEARVLWFERTRLMDKIFVRGWHGLRPIIGGAPEGAGALAGGIGYTRGLESELVRLSASASTSTNHYQILDTRLVFPTELGGSPLRVMLEASSRDHTRFSFYGIGNDSADRRSFYRIKDASAGGELTCRMSRRIVLGAGARWLSARTDGDSRSPTVDAVFTGDARPPGFDAPRSDFAVYGAHATVDLRDGGSPAAGPKLRLAATRHEDIDNRFDFTRLEAALAAYLPLGYRNRIVAARIATSHSMPDHGQRVPFYLMDPIGGSRTLRGFDSNRFRDLRSLVINLEYRWEVWTYADFALFYDSGKVFSSADDLDLSGFHDGYGFGIRAHSPFGGMFRWDIAHGDEGLHMHIWVGNAMFFNE